MNDTDVDVLVIGGGPAGLAAATTLMRQLHTVIVFDSGTYRSDGQKHMHNMATWDGRDPAEFRAAAKKDILTHYETARFENMEIKKVKEVEGGFIAEDGNGKMWRGKKLILATGVVDDFPEIKGFGKCWGKTIFHCLFCHGYESRGGTAGVLAINMVSAPHMAMHIARNAAELSKSVTIYTHGSEKLKSELIQTLGDDPKFRVDSRTIKGFSMVDGAIELEFEDGNKTVETFLAHVPRSHPRGPFVEQLKLKTVPPLGDVEVTQPFMQTSVRGVFACGDNMIMAKTVATAVANGALAANGASSQLQAEKYGHKPLF